VNSEVQDAGDRVTNKSHSYSWGLHFREKNWLKVNYQICLEVLHEKKKKQDK
jgi:hypothetical protein